MEGLWNPWGPLASSCARTVSICRMLSLGPPVWAHIQGSDLCRGTCTALRSWWGEAWHQLLLQTLRDAGRGHTKTCRDTRPVTNQLQLQRQ